METLTHQQLIQNIIQDYAEKHPQEDTIETQVIFDQKNHHYLLLYIGWLKEKHIHGCPIHVEIKEQKFWIHRDLTEQGIKNQLLAAGVSPENIVLAFRSPSFRKLTELTTA